MFRRKERHDAAAAQTVLPRPFTRYMTFLPTEIRQLIPSWFLVVDSGAQVHVPLTLIILAHVQDGGQRRMNWGGKDHHGRCTNFGWLTGVTYIRSPDNVWAKHLITTGVPDAWVVPTGIRQLNSTQSVDPV